MNAVQYPSPHLQAAEAREGTPPHQNPSLPRRDRGIVRARSARVNMSRLRFAILLAASSFGVLLVAAASASSSRPPEVYSVGDETGRAAPPGNDDGTAQTLREWAMRQRFYVGDVLGKLSATPSKRRRLGLISILLVLAFVPLLTHARTFGPGSRFQALERRLGPPRAPGRLRAVQRGEPGGRPVLRGRRRHPVHARPPRPFLLHQRRPGALRGWPSDGRARRGSPQQHQRRHDPDPDAGAGSGDPARRHPVQAPPPPSADYRADADGGGGTRVRGRIHYHVLDRWALHMLSLVTTAVELE